MFTGIVESVGHIVTKKMGDQSQYFLIQTVDVWSDLKLGESVAINGVCLTVTEFESQTFAVTVVPETLRKTNLGSLQVNDSVNLERSLLATTRMGGHFVQGHIDGVATVSKLEREGEALLLTLTLPDGLSAYVVNKGFIAIDGMSITVIDIDNNDVQVTLIPHTLQVTIANRYQVGSRLNIEVDMMAKYIEKYVRVYQ